jgi:hypothetical protein
MQSSYIYYVCKLVIYVYLVLQLLNLCREVTIAAMGRIAVLLVQVVPLLHDSNSLVCPRNVIVVEGVSGHLQHDVGIVHGRRQLGYRPERGVGRRQEEEGEEEGVEDHGCARSNRARRSQLLTVQLSNFNEAKSTDLIYLRADRHPSAKYEASAKL